MSKISFKDKSYITVERSPKGKLFIAISAKDSDNPRKTVTNSVEIDDEEYTELFGEFITIGDTQDLVTNSPTRDLVVLNNDDKPDSWTKYGLDISEPDGYWSSEDEEEDLDKPKLSVRERLSAALKEAEEDGYALTEPYDGDPVEEAHQMLLSASDNEPIDKYVDAVVELKKPAKKKVAKKKASTKKKVAKKKATKKKKVAKKKKKAVEGDEE